MKVFRAGILGVHGFCLEFFIFDPPKLKKPLKIGQIPEKSHPYNQDVFDQSGLNSGVHMYGVSGQYFTNRVRHRLLFTSGLIISGESPGNLVILVCVSVHLDSYLSNH